MNDSPDEIKPLLAANVFGGADALSRRLALMIRVTREARGYSQEDLAAKAREGDVSSVADLEETEKLPPKTVLMAYLDALGLPVQNVMQIESLDSTMEMQWTQEMRRRKVALMAQGNGVDPAEVSTVQHKRWALELFLRIEALNEVCAKAPRVAGIEDRATRMQAVLGRI